MSSEGGGKSEGAKFLAAFDKDKGLITQLMFLPVEKCSHRACVSAQPLLHADAVFLSEGVRVVGLSLVRQ